MKLVVVDSECLDVKCSLDLNEVFSIEYYSDEGEGTVVLQAWVKGFTDSDGSSDNFYIVNNELDGETEELKTDTFNEQKDYVEKMYSLIHDFWSDDSKKVCFITDATLRGYTPKMRLSPFE